MQTSDRKICQPKSIQIAISVLLFGFSLSGCGQDYKVAMSRLSETDVMFPKQTVTKITRVPLIADSPIDILWLVDNSPGAIDIHPAFTQGINLFAKKYLSPGAESLLNKDLRIAAIPTDLYLAGSSACVARTDLLADVNGSEPANPLPCSISMRTPNVSGHYGSTTGQSSISTWPPPRGAAATWVDNDGNFYLLGGESNVHVLGDFWKWDGFQWTWMSGPKNNEYDTLSALGFRAYSATFSDPNYLRVIGGHGRTSAQRFVDGTQSRTGTLNDFMSWEKNTNPSEQNEWQSNFPPSFSWRERAMYASTSDNKVVWIFGGIRPGERLSDLWKGKWNDKSKEREWSSKLNTSPFSPMGASAWTKNDAFYVFGGCNSEDVFCTNAPVYNNNFWRWSEGEQWTPVPTSIPIPTPRAFASTWTDIDGNFWLFGGYSSDEGWLGDLWKWDGSWSKIIPNSAKAPSARRYALSWRDSAGNLWLFGGQANSDRPAYVNDLWKYDPLTNYWKQIRSIDLAYKYPNNYSYLKGGSRKAVLATKDPLVDLNRFSGDFKSNVNAGLTGGSPPSGFASLAKFIKNNETKKACSAGESLESCAFFRPNSKRVLIHVSNSFDFSQRDRVTMTDAVKNVGTSAGQTGSKFEKYFLDNFFRELDKLSSNNPGYSNNDPSYMSIGFINKSTNCEDSGQATPPYYPAPLKAGNYFCSYQNFINELKSDALNSLAKYSAGYDSNMDDFSEVLEPFGRIVETITTSVIDIAEFQLEDTPDFSFSVVINVVHADGSTITIPPNFYTIEGRTLKITNPGFAQMVSLTDKLKVTYVQTTTAS